MRKLASIQKITSIQSVENSDHLVALGVLGWKVVARRGDFQVGDLCIYFEIDAILPTLPTFEFLAKTNYRLTTVRLRGQLSQGLCWHTDILPERTEIFEGKDVTDILGVTKYEEEIPEDMKGKSKGFFPRIVSKTGETRVQSFPELIQEFMGKRIAISTKIDGVSASYINDQGELHVCSHTHSLLETPENPQWKMAHRYGLLDILQKKGYLSIQGEITGPGIFGNQLELPEIDLFIFKIFDNEHQRYYTPLEVIDFCRQNGLKHVPMELDVDFNFSLPDLLDLARGNYQGTENPREGVVIYTMEPTYSEILCGNLSMKVINNEFLEKKKKKRKRDK